MNTLNTSRDIENPLIGILLLNWNGTKDTIECLESLLKMTYDNYLIFVLDNGSEIAHKDLLNEWFMTKSQKVENYEFLNYKLSKFLIDNLSIVLLLSECNLGFAKGNNLLARIAEYEYCEYILLLNNDTTVEPDFLTKLVHVKQQNNEIFALTPKIKYYYFPSLIWNCGGKLSIFGIKQNYYFADCEEISSSEQETFFQVTFITGCALFLDYKKTGLLTEDFFHGEEDFEFALRMKKAKMKMVCVPDSVIYHKVGKSINSKSKTKANKILLHYVNRLINLKSYCNTFIWGSILFFSILHFIYSLRKNCGLALNQIIKFVAFLIKKTIFEKKVNQDLFNSIMDYK